MGALVVPAVALVCGLAAEARAQPGQPVVQINGDFSVTVSYPAPTAPPAAGALLVATFNGAPFPGSPFNIGQATTVASPPLELGTYTVQVLWGAQASPVTTFSLGAALGAPFLRAAAVDLNTVLLSWDPASGVVAGYDLEATDLRTMQVYTASIGNQTSLTVRNVFPGTYSVRLRAQNKYGPGPFSNSITVTVGSVLALGDLQATLTWNTTADMDLHLLEPDGSHVYYGAKDGPSARLDFDDIDGFGPENMFVSAGRSLAGIYQIYLVHNSQSLETTSTVSITLGAGTSVAKTVLFSRRTRRAEPRTAVFVGMVNVRTGEVVEWVGTGAADEVAGPSEEKRKPE
jgi:hypothetical protein